MPVADCLPIFALCQLPSAFCLLPTTCCPLRCVFRLLPPAYRLLPPTLRLLPTALCRLPSADCPLPTASFLLRRWGFDIDRIAVDPAARAALEAHMNFDAKHAWLAAGDGDGEVRLVVPAANLDTVAQQAQAAD